MFITKRLFWFRLLAVIGVFSTTLFFVMPSQAQIGAPSESGSCVDQDMAVIAYAGVVPAGTQFVREKLFAPLNTNAVEETTFIRAVCSVQATNGQSTFDPYITICVPLQPGDTALAGGRQSNLRVGVFADSIWQPLRLSPNLRGVHGIHTEVCGEIWQMPADITEFGLVTLTPQTLPATGFSFPVGLLRMAVYGSLSSVLFGSLLMFQLRKKRQTAD